MHAQSTSPIHLSDALAESAASRSSVGLPRARLVSSAGAAAIIGVRRALMRARRRRGREAPSRPVLPAHLPPCTLSTFQSSSLRARADRGRGASGARRAAGPPPRARQGARASAASRLVAVLPGTARTPRARPSRTARRVPTTAPGHCCRPRARRRFERTAAACGAPAATRPDEMTWAHQNWVPFTTGRNRHTYAATRPCGRARRR